MPKDIIAKPFEVPVIGSREIALPLYRHPNYLSMANWYPPSPAYGITVVLPLLYPYLTQ
jgi:hypothetical protein